MDSEAARRKPVFLLLAPTGKFRAVVSFFKLAQSDAEGKFRLGGITPGTYKLFALEQPPAGDLRNPELADKLAPLGKDVVAAEGARITVKPSLITPQQLREALQ